MLTFPDGVTHREITLLIHGKTNREAISQSGSFDFRVRIMPRTAGDGNSGGAGGKGTSGERKSFVS